MTLSELITSLELHKNEFPADTHFVDRSIDWIKTYGDFAFVKDNLQGHFTWSLLIMNRERTKVLLMLHKKLHLWLHFWGHCDGEIDVRKVALREFHEESWIEIDPDVQVGIFLVDVHDIPPDAKGRPEHYHFDIMHLGIIDESTPFSRQIEEVDDIRWFDILWIEEFVSPGMAQRIARIQELKT